ncbi:MAG: Zn-dependent oligopeptidase, partial [Candidatus Heimdallarchaeota archaeon]|nr:Zn-dependent oligopeptidase [Candidatus Heimdallarchaeota archaeon]
MELSIEEKAIELSKKLNWGYSAQDIETKTDEIIKEISENVEEIENTNENEINFNNIIRKRELFDGEISTKLAPIGFLSNVSPNDDVRNASNLAMQKLSQFFIDLTFRKKSYEVVKKVAEKNENLDDVEKRLLKRYLSDFKRAGLDLDEVQQEKLKKLYKEISEIRIKFSRNLNENNDNLIVDLDELKGVSDSVIESFFTNEAGKYIVPVKSPNYLAIMEFCRIPKTRKEMQILWESRCMNENVTYFEKTIELRHEVAQILGYKNFAEYELEEKMAKNPETVNNFLLDLIDRLRPYKEIELKKLIDLKNEELKENSNGSIEGHDRRYYTRMFQERELALDMKKVSEYFPSDFVVVKMLEFYQEIFDLTFQKIEIDTWHEDVTCFAISDSKTSEFIGIFYLDLYPRKGKFGHAAAAPLIAGRLTDNGYHPTAAAMMCNFNKSTPKKPALLSFNDVTTLFHEFGHIIHQTCTKSRFTRFSGSRVARDFVEAPSQMLENWLVEKEVLKLITQHYQTKEPIPDEYISGLKRINQVGEVIHTLRQIFFGRFDMLAHLEGKVDSMKLWHSLRKEIIGIDTPEGTNGSASFGHLMGGYAVGYYGYQWSRSLAQDLYTRFEKEGAMSKKVGMDYRKLILEPGNEIDEKQLV